MLENDIPTEDFTSTFLLPADENNTVDNFSVSEESNQTLDPDEIVDETPEELPTSSFSSVPEDVQSPPAPLEKPFVEPPKHTYASIVCESISAINFIFVCFTLNLTFRLFNQIFDDVMLKFNSCELQSLKVHHI